MSCKWSYHYGNIIFTDNELESDKDNYCGFVWPYGERLISDGYYLIKDTILYSLDEYYNIEK